MATVNAKKQGGLALITVLMILAVLKVIAVTVAATMSGRLTLSLKRTEAVQ